MTKNKNMGNEKTYSLEYLERCIGAGLSIGYDKDFDIDNKSEMVQRIIKSMPPPPVILKNEHGIKLPTDRQTADWFDDNIGLFNDVSASSAIYKFRLWLNELNK